MTNTNIQRKYAQLLIALEENGGAECEQMPEIFFPEDSSGYGQRKREIEIAKALCNRCPIVEPCLIYAMTAKESWGIWAGTTPDQRTNGGSRKRNLRA